MEDFIGAIQHNQQARKRPGRIMILSNILSSFGRSFYKLPKILQWFSGNIGFHHIHHLSPAIPNYHLEKCHRSEPLFQSVKPITLLSSLKSLTFRLWDERCQKLVGYRAARILRNQRNRRAQITRTFHPA